MTKYGIFLILLLLLLVPAATAAEVTITPTKVDPGDTVTVEVRGLSDNATFSLGISAEFDVNPGEKFSFTARDLSLPFSLNDGVVSAYTRGTNLTSRAIFCAERGETSLVQGKPPNEDGEILISLEHDIPSGTYDVITLRGEAAAKSIITEMTMTGKKKGPADGTISFALEGVESGTATVAVYIDGSEALSQKIAIGSAPGPVETEVPSSGGSGGSSGSGGSCGSSGSSGSSGPAPATTSSVDGRVSLIGTDIDGAGVLALAVEGTLPDGWSTVGRAYAVTPADREFTSPAVLSFSLPTAETTATIARLENDTWSPIPSKIKGDLITTTVSRGGSYVLLVPAAPEPDPTVTTVTTTATATSTATPVTTTPAATPLAPLLPLLACAILMLARGRRG